MSYVDEVLERVKAKNASEPEFLQAVEEVLESTTNSLLETSIPRLIYQMV